MVEAVVLALPLRSRSGLLPLPLRSRSGLLPLPLRSRSALLVADLMLRKLETERRVAPADLRWW